MSPASTRTPERISPEPADVVRLGQIALAFGRVNRITRHEDGVTPESDTTHTVMLGLIACALAERWYPHLNRGLVAEYALVHDLVEVHAGDTPTLSIDAAGAAAKEHREQQAAQRLEEEFIGSLPWVPLMIAAYEDRATPEARFVRAVDKALPKITHRLNGNATLIAQGITRAELQDSWNRQAVALTGYASDFPELLSLCADLVAAVAADYDGPVAASDPGHTATLETSVNAEPLSGVLATAYDWAAVSLGSPGRWATLGWRRKQVVRVMWESIARGERDPFVVGQAGWARAAAWANPQCWRARERDGELQEQFMPLARCLIHAAQSDASEPVSTGPTPITGPESGQFPMAERSCRVCGCTEDNACWPPCWWASDGLCSACSPPGSLSGSHP